MKAYDVIVIGSGPGGMAAAERAARYGKRVLVIERQWIGGTYTHMGAVPSKALIDNARIAWLLKHQGEQFGFDFQNLSLKYASAVRRSRSVSEDLSVILKNKMTDLGIDFFVGNAKVSAINEISVIRKDGSQEYYKTDHIVIATGADPLHLPQFPIDGKQIITYQQAVLQERLPEHVLIVGGGALGVEFATVWNNYGVQVTIVELESRLVSYEDEEIGPELEKVFKERGMRILTDSQVKAVQIIDDRINVKVETSQSIEEINVDQVLEAISFKHNSSGIGLESLGVELGPNGMIVVDDHMQTTVAGIWAVGDVNGRLMLAISAAAQGEVCAENICGFSRVLRDEDFENMQKVTYSQPQIGSFGMTEGLARERGYSIKIGRAKFNENARAICKGQTQGWVKVITNAETDQILGVHMIADQVDDLLPQLSFVKWMENTPQEFSRHLQAKPTLSESLKLAAQDMVWEK
ncbi:MAG: dihydrolipoyl dehydrogenase [Anaerolineaceae bacterium]|nr:dihydrolipoyl dehydrogenase [Anaerolineaceae bacterium]